MAKRLAFTILVTVLGTSAVLTACGDDEDRTGDMVGGEAGEHTGGSKTAGSSSGGTSAGKGGSLTLGGQMQGGQGGASGDTGMAGEGGDQTMGGAPGGGGATDGGAAGIGGAGGDGGAPNPPVAYACGSSSISRRLCSAYIAAECESLPACTDESPPGSCCTDCPAPVCPDCVALTDIEREPFAECPACLAEYDRNLLCGIEPFEAGNVSEGIACFDMYGAYQVEDCDPFLFSAQNCLEHAEVEGECPATWPLPPG